MTASRFLIFVLFCCVPATASLAEDASKEKFILLVNDSAPGVEQLLDRRLADAIDSASSTPRALDPLGANTLLCAALIARRDLDDAVAPCDAAVDLAQVPITTGLNPHGHSNRDALAIAYSNRAVLNWLLGDSEAASSDILRALRQNRYADEIRHNQRLVANRYLASSE